MTDKPRQVEYRMTENGYIHFKNLNEYPSLADIKYVILMTLQHFKNTKNTKRYFEIKQFINDALSSTNIDEFREDYDLNKFI